MLLPCQACLAMQECQVCLKMSVSPVQLLGRVDLMSCSGKPPSIFHSSPLLLPCHLPCRELGRGVLAVDGGDVTIGWQQFTFFSSILVVALTVTLV